MSNVQPITAPAPAVVREDTKEREIVFKELCGLEIKKGAQFDTPNFSAWRVAFMKYVRDNHEGMKFTIRKAKDEAKEVIPNKYNIWRVA